MKEDELIAKQRPSHMANAEILLYPTFANINLLAKKKKEIKRKSLVKIYYSVCDGRLY